MGDNRLERLRRFFAHYVAARGRSTDRRMAEAFAAVPREPFAGPGPWSIKVPGQDGGIEAVCSLRRGGTPDDSCWLRGDGWWLSTADPEVA